MANKGRCINSSCAFPCLTQPFGAANLNGRTAVVVTYIWAASPSVSRRCTSWTPATTSARTSITAAACQSKASARPSTSTCTTARAWGGTSLSQSWISFAAWRQCWRGRRPIASTRPRCSSSMRERWVETCFFLVYWWICSLTMSLSVLIMWWIRANLFFDTSQMT